MSIKSIENLLFIAWTAVVILASPSLVLAQEKEKPSPIPVTTSAPDVPVAELQLRLQPLTKGELLTEASGWQTLVQKKSVEIAEAEIVLKRLNSKIQEAEDAKAAAETAAADLQQATQKLAEARSSGDEAAVKAAEQAIEEARMSLAEAEERTVKTAQASEGDKERVEKMAETSAALRDERTLLIDRFNAVLDEIENKTDKADTDSLNTVRDYRLYVSAVTGIKVDVDDTQSAWLVIKNWLTSEEGGLRWAKNIAIAVGILIAAWILSTIVGALVHRGLKASSRTSALLAIFLVGTVRWLIMIVGVVSALAALEVSIGPMLAVVGAAGFVIAFALQDSLSNVASGLMILFFKPFDTGEVVTAGGVTGKVASMNLVSTTIQTFDNQRMVVPNNKIWKDVITNITGVDHRRVDLEFGIGYSDDVDKAQALLEEIVANHPKVLKEPEPIIKLHALADSSVNFICRPWAKPEDFGTVRWDIIKAVKKRFDEEGIGIPFPQRDVHLYVKDRGAERTMDAVGNADKAGQSRDRDT